MKLPAPEHDDLLLQVGRPRREEGKRPSIARSIRLPVRLWKQIESEARRLKMTRNAAMRQAAMTWLRSPR